MIFPLPPGPAGPPPPRPLRAPRVPRWHSRAAAPPQPPPPSCGPASVPGVLPRDFFVVLSFFSSPVREWVCTQRDLIKNCPQKLSASSLGKKTSPPTAPRGTCHPVLQGCLPFPRSRFSSSVARPRGGELVCLQARGPLGSDSLRFLWAAPELPWLGAGESGLGGEGSGGAGGPWCSGSPGGQPVWDESEGDTPGLEIQAGPPPPEDGDTRTPRTPARWPPAVP